MTVAAYREAIAWAARHDVELGLECDVHFSADDQLICLHDLRLDRTSNATGPAFGRTVDELRMLDFGSWKLAQPSANQRAMVTLHDLLIMVRDARTAGIKITLAIETKHPNPRHLEIEHRVAEMLADFGWDQPGSPIRLISFSQAAITELGRILPGLERTFLIQVTFGRWGTGELPDGVRIVGPDLALIKRDPDFVARARAHGNEVHVWTVNRAEDIRRCRDLGVTGFTTDYPDRVETILSGRADTGLRRAIGRLRTSKR